ncbi:hypothetical protein JCM8547_009237 [Rhodosporidiobolus lusitaniae]
MSFLRRAHYWLAYALVAYLAFLVALIYEPFQRSLIYLHAIKLGGRHFDRPEYHGYAPGKVLPLNLTTPDGARLGAWLVPPQSVYEKWVEGNGVPGEGESMPLRVYDEALRSPSHPTVIYYHGNAATRAAGNRVRTGRHISSEMDASFLIIDYRGFADSSSHLPPSEEGLLTDARTAWDYITVEKGAKESQVVVMGQSLGTGVTAGLAARLADEGKHPRAVVLVAPFSSISALLETYKLGNFIPILSPLKRFPWLLNAFLQLLRTKFDTQNVLEKIQAPLLILHAQDDPVIPFSHSRTLATHLLSPLLSTQSSSSFFSSPEALTREHLVKETKIGGWGTVSRFSRGEGKGDVTWAEGIKGAHNEIGTGEFSMKLIKDAVLGTKVTV